MSLTSNLKQIWGRNIGYMEKSIYGVMQIRLYYRPIWLKVGIAYHIISLSYRISI
jgi:hypothetical protein